ncbi:cytochrome c [Desulfonema ishimotonii]|uniref:Cytochrome c n=1 Tax=Desulfonema ishimotonii TaxID=45657 RepID=A0A401FS22_9BACT|nr:cytochrome ubiquinol oxidase subunit I [Desulfonema ishimotonii]GBC59771.1 cytochrome c [Desulfonema ishimotonii]
MNSSWLLHYPVWESGVLGGGFWIAFMATIHVYIAHFAVGGGLFLVLTEMKGYRENSQPILDYTRKHTKFFLLLTAVFGSVTGVGIWFVISVLSPAATSALIHYFVFGWATEWVFFLGEIVTLFVYFYTFGRMDRKNHLRVGWLYFIFGWLSLFVINGIIAWMLTPGDWLSTRNFWDGFFNPSFWPSTAFRTAISLMLAGLFGYITSLRIEAAEVRERLLQYCTKWLLIPLGMVLVSGVWYVLALPEPQQNMILNRSPETLRFLKVFAGVTPLIFVIGLLMARRMPLGTKKVLAGLLVIIGLAYMGAFEWVREAGRRPYIIHGHTWSNSVNAADLNAIRQAGVLKSARWAKYREITPENRMSAGHELFKFLCSSCHSVGGPMNDILPLTDKYTVFGMEAMLDGMGKINTYMPPFMGTTQERDTLAAYIAEALHHRKETPPTAADINPIPVEVPPFDPQKDEYVLLAWTGKGMHCISDSDRYFSFSPPGSDIYAQLIRRGESPEKVEEAQITYRLNPGFEQPAEFADFWKHARSLIGKAIPENTGLTGNTTAGRMVFDAESEAYVAEGVPVVPYTDGGQFMPYPLVTVEASDTDGNLLASAKITAPVSTEMGCKLCHGGEWRVNGQAGLGDNTARDILAVHDRMNRTDLAKRAEKGKPVMCQSCHGADDETHLSLSAAIHGFHANYLTGRGAESCAACHPGLPSGVTNAFRGIHREAGLDCTSCHGTMEDHSLSLLVAEKQAGKQSADVLMKHLRPVAVDTVDAVLPRKPWVSAPDCLGCHVDFQQPDVFEIFNRWTASEADLYRNRSGEAGVKCMACHGSTHAIWPATNPFGNDRDNIPPMQYQKNPYPMGANRNCKVCHTVDMAEEIHHPNSLAMFRNLR